MEGDVNILVLTKICIVEFRNMCLRAASAGSEWPNFQKTEGFSFFPGALGGKTWLLQKHLKCYTLYW